MWVVKLGGSWSGIASLPQRLRHIARCGAGRIVLVPGGGPFADQVRGAQRRWGFDDRTAHRMALLAMHQYGWMLAGLCDRLLPIDRTEALTAAPAGRVPVWLPDVRELDAAGIPASWSVTSDTLAAWLTRRLRAEGLMLLKRGRIPTEDPQGLRQAGIVDPAFPDRFPAGVALRVFGDGEFGACLRFLRRLGGGSR